MTGINRQNYDGLRVTWSVKNGRLKLRFESNNFYLSIPVKSFSQEDRTDPPEYYFFSAKHSVTVVLFSAGSDLPPGNDRVKLRVEQMSDGSRSEYYFASVTGYKLLKVFNLLSREAHNSVIPVIPVNISLD